MCLKLYHKFTFSNREAYERVLRIIGKGKYATLSPHGKIFILVAHDFPKKEIDETHCREAQPYESLIEFTKQKNVFFTREISFNNHKEFRQARMSVLRAVDLFGEVTMEIR